MNPSTNSSISSDSAIGHDGFVEDHILHPGSFNNGASQVTPGQISSNHVSRIKGGIDELGIREVGATKAGVIQGSSSQIRTGKIGTNQTNLSHGAVPQNSSTQIGSLQVRLAEVGTTQINSTQVGTSHIDELYWEPREVSFSGSVPPQQLFTVNQPYLFHDNLARISDSITTFWNRALAVDTPFDLQLSFADLPSGQLAETTVTKYDTKGRPANGQISIDIDANGQGWYLDTTTAGVSSRASLRPFEGDVTTVGSSVVIPPPQIGSITKTNAVSEVSSSDYGLSPINSGQIGFDERGAVALGVNHIGISEIGALEVGSVERAFSQGDPFKVGKPQIGIDEIGVGEGSFSQVNPLKTGSHQRCLGETAFSQVRSSKINAIESGIPELASYQYDSLQVSTGEFPMSEVALPASVSLQ